ncbi:hypothetical protein DH2020_017587 [Rehmannia glutinosa]|uniref:GRF-type domain-containing protein n=1 Tax=Rehmannia glutinosa TaxID=99300 RepID=A0ABR0WRC5_REHGL
MWKQTSEVIMDVFCNCGRNATMKTSWTDLNPGRRYMACQKFKEVGGCTFFNWIDPPMCSRARQIIPGLLKKINKLEDQVKEFEKLEDQVKEFDKLEGKMKRNRNNEIWLWMTLFFSWIVAYLMM